MAGAEMAAAGVADAIAGGASAAVEEDATIFVPAAASRTTNPAATCVKFAGTPSSSLHSERTFTFLTTT